MARLYLISLLIVAAVAVAGLAFYLQTENTGLVNYHNCYRYANEFDVVSPIYPTRQINLLGDPDFSVQEMNFFNLCSGEEAPGVAIYFNRDPPLETHHRFQWHSDDVYAWSGGPEPKIGYIQYWICADGRARVILSGIEVCNTLSPI